MHQVSNMTWTARQPLLIHRGIGDLLRNRTLQRIVRGYLGQDAMLDRINVQHLASGLRVVKDYPSAMWHHDAAGRRLKMLVFLHDVGSSY